MLRIGKLVRDYNTSARSFNELAPWMSLILPHMVINKDGSLLSCYQFEGIDQEGREAVEIDRYVSLLEHAMRSFDEKIAVWYTVDRRRTDDYPSSKFDHHITQYVDDCWKDKFTAGHQYINRHYLSVLFTPPSGAEGFFEKITHFMRKEGRGVFSSIMEAIKTSILSRNAYTFEEMQLYAQIAEFSEKLSAFDETVLDLNMSRMENDTLLGFLHRRCSPTSTEESVRVPSVPAYLDSYLPSDTLVSRGDTLHFKGSGGHKHVSGISLKDWPDFTEPGLIDALLAVPGEITISHVFRFAEQNKARKYIQDVERHNRNMEKSLLSYLKESVTHEESRQRNVGRVMMAEDASNAMTEMSTHNRSYGYHNLTMLAYGNTQDESETTMKIMSQILRRRGFLVVRENMHLLSAFAGCMPGQWGMLVRWFFISASNLADMAPIRTLGIGSKINKHLTEQLGANGKKYPALTVFSTEYATPYYFNFHQSDLAHTIVIGPSRTGKSTLDNFLILQFQKYAPCTTIIFDKDYSCRIPTVLQGGEHVDLMGDHSKRMKLNPMILLDDRHHWGWLAQWLEILLTSRDYTITAEDDETIQRALESVAAQPRDMWQLKSLMPFLSKKLAEQLLQWVGDGANAKFFDNAEDTFDVGDKTCIEMGGLFFNPVLATAFLEYAFYRINQKLNGDPTLIYIEEAWFMLANERFAGRINDWLRTLAKKNAMLLMATQSLDEIAKSEIFMTIIDNIPNRIFLANQNAYAHKEMYREKFSLNDMQVSRIQGAIPKQHYYAVTPLLSRMLEVSFPPEILACVRSDSKAQKVFNKHYGSGDDWDVNYIEEMCRA